MSTYKIPQEIKKIKTYKANEKPIKAAIKFSFDTQKN
jgi:hypothetical protein